MSKALLGEPKTRVFGGKPPCAPVLVCLDYVPDPKSMQNDITEFTLKQCRMMDFRTEPMDLREVIYLAVLDKSTQQHKIFKPSIDEIHERNY